MTFQILEKYILLAVSYMTLSMMYVAKNTDNWREFGCFYFKINTSQAVSYREPIVLVYEVFYILNI